MVFQWLKNSYQALQKTFVSTKRNIGIRLQKLFGRYVDEALLEEVEEVLYEADLGVSVCRDLLGKMRIYMRQHPKAKVEDILHIVEEGLLDEMRHLHHALRFAPEGIPTVILIVGTNGNGKTTSCAKLAHLLKEHFGKSVLLGSCDTFRAAAQEQLSTWAQRASVDIVRGQDGGDPAAVAFDAVVRALSRKMDVVLLDTAGRLENKQHLLQELEKIRKSCEKAYIKHFQGMPTSTDVLPPHETFLVVDATTGQNGIEQAKAFHAVAPLTGIILTKLDGSAKGGTVISIQKSLHLPVKYIGLGESIDDFAAFEPQEFVKALLETQPIE